MSRSKKKRTGLMFVLERKPSKREFLEDPQSKESRKKKALADKKKPKSVYQKNLEQKKSSEQAGNLQQPVGGRLAAKIKKLNSQKSTEK